MLTWEDKYKLNLFLDAARNTIGAAKRVVYEDDWGEDKTIPILQSAQDMLCEAVALLVKTLRLENERGGYCADATTGKPPSATVEVVKPKEIEE